MNTDGYNIIDCIKTDSFCYLLFAGICQLLLAGVGSLIIVSVSIKKHDLIGRRILRFALFNALMLVFGTIANAFWSHLVWGRFYESTDYFVDFLPFWPITQSVIDRPWGDQTGHLIGVTLFQLQLIWLLFATVTWGLTILAYRLIIHRRVPRGTMPMVPANA